MQDSSPKGSCPRSEDHVQGERLQSAREKETSKFKPVTVLIAVLAVSLAGVSAYFYLRPSQQQSDMLTTYGRVTDLDYQGTMISMVFVSGTDISLYSASIAYTANNHAVSQQSYQTPLMPIGSQPAR